PITETQLPKELVPPELPSVDATVCATPPAPTVTVSVAPRTESAISNGNAPPPGPAAAKVPPELLDPLQPPLATTPRCFKYPGGFVQVPLARNRVRYGLRTSEINCVPSHWKSRASPGYMIQLVSPSEDGIVILPVLVFQIRIHQLAPRFAKVSNV